MTFLVAASAVEVTEKCKVSWASSGTWPAHAAKLDHSNSVWNKAKVTERNALETIIFSTKQKLEDDAEYFEEDDKETIEEAVQSALDWMDENPEADLEDIKDRRMDLEDELKPLMHKVQQAKQEAAEDAEYDDDDHEEL